MNWKGEYIYSSTNFILPSIGIDACPIYWLILYFYYFFSFLLSFGFYLNCERSEACNIL